MNAPARKALPRLARNYLRELTAGIGKPRVRFRQSEVAVAEARLIGLAHHEAAHAVVNRCVCGSRPVTVTIESGLETGGYVKTHSPMSAKMMREIASRQPEFEDEFRRGIEQRSLQTLAGPVEDAVRDDHDALDYLFYYCEEPTPGGTDDISRVWDSLNTFEPNPRRAARWFNRLVVRTERLVLRPEVQAAITRFVEALLDSPTLEGDELDDLVFEVEKTVPSYVGWPRRKRRK